MNSFRCALWNEALRCSLRSEANNPRQVEVLIAAVKIMEAKLALKLRIPLFTAKVF